MAFARPTLSELKTRIQADFESRLTLAGSPLPRSVVKVMSFVLAGAVHMLFGFLDSKSEQMLPDTAEDDGVKRWGTLLGVTQTPAQFATGTVTVTGSNGLQALEDEILVRSDGKEFRIDADVTIAGGTGTANVTAETADEDSNCDAGVELTFESPVAGVDATATVVEISGGADTEDIEDYRERILARLSSPPNGGSEADYVAWAKEVSGVTRAWCIPNQTGAGTVGVYFVRDNDGGSIIPSAGEVTEVQDYIDERRPVTADVTVAAPTDSPTAFTISITPDTTANREAVEAELEDLFLRVATPEGGTITLGQIDVAVGTAGTVTDFTITVPAAPITSTVGNLPSVGTITWV